MGAVIQKWIWLGIFTNNNYSTQLLVMDGNVHFGKMVLSMHYEHAPWIACKVDGIVAPIVTIGMSISFWPLLLNARSRIAYPIDTLLAYIHFLVLLQLLVYQVYSVSEHDINIHKAEAKSLTMYGL